jgi:DNA modification methylase
MTALIKQAHAPLDAFIGRLITGHAADIMADLPPGSIDLIITSPPYWTAVEYAGGKSPWTSYGDYLADLHTVWAQCARVLRPNGKLCINAPLMPIPQAVIRQQTRHLKNIAFDIEHGVLKDTDLERYALFVWQKQTSKMMFGSYPYPGNLIENNTIEFINAYVKPGKPPKRDPAVKAANRLSRAEWLDLTQQVWFMYPEDVKRGGNHPAPFPQRLPGRLMRLYSYGATANFPGEIVLDPFAGTGTTCAVARCMGRRFIGIDINHAYIAIARQKIREAAASQPLLLVGRAKYPAKHELTGLLARRPGSAGKAAEVKHKRKTYGRKIPVRDSDPVAKV